MTYQPPPQHPQFGQPYGQQPPVVSGPPAAYGAPPPGFPPAQPPAKKWGPGKIILVCVAAVAGVCVFGGIMSAVNSNGSTSSAGPDGKTVTTGAAGAAGAAGTAPAAKKADGTPKASDFKLTPKITSKQCFGTAGCNVDYKVDVAYTGPKLDDSDTWDITYQATGDESGPVIDQIALTGTQYDGETRSISTASSNTKITIKVTDVEKE